MNAEEVVGHEWRASLATPFRIILKFAPHIGEGRVICAVVSARFLCQRALAAFFCCGPRPYFGWPPRLPKTRATKSATLTPNSKLPNSKLPNSKLPDSSLVFPYSSLSEEDRNSSGPSLHKCIRANCKSLVTGKTCAISSSTHVLTYVETGRQDLHSLSTCAQFLLKQVNRLHKVGCNATFSS